MRYYDAEHFKLVERAVKKSRMSKNAWLVQATLAQARFQLGIKWSMERPAIDPEMGQQLAAKQSQAEQRLDSQISSG
jgi:hypothetical protein